MKIWRALWQVSASMRYCTADEDPSFGIRRETPKGRSETWSEGEVIRLVKAAWRCGYRGLACIIAVAYDTQLAPVDARSLRLEDSRSDGQKLWFDVERAKTGRGALGTLSRRTQALVRAYVAMLPADFLPSAPIFLTRRGAAYRKNSLARGLPRHPPAGAPGGHAAAPGHAAHGRRWRRSPAEPTSASSRKRCEYRRVVAGGAPEDLSTGQLDGSRDGGRGPKTRPPPNSGEQGEAKS